MTRDLSPPAPGGSAANGTGPSGPGDEPVSVVRSRLRSTPIGRVSDPVFRALVTSAGVSVLLILAAMLVRTTADAWPIFQKEGFFGFLFGDEWTGGTARRGAAVEEYTGTYGAWPFIYGTLKTSSIAIVIALPTAIAVAICINKLAPRRLKQPLAYGVETLAAVPSIVYGLWGLLFLAPTVIRPFMEMLERNLGEHIFLFEGPVFTTSYFTLGVVLAIMILPISTAVIREVMAAVPVEEEHAAYGMGATRWEVVRKVTLPRSFSGIVGGTMLGLGRAIGETVAAAMLVGSGQSWDTSLLASGDTMAGHIANTFQDARPETVTGLLAMGVALFVFTTVVNVGARALVWRVGRVSGDAAV